MKKICCVLLNCLFIWGCNCSSTAPRTVTNTAKDSTLKGHLKQEINPVMELNTKPMTCKLTSPELQKRKITVIAAIKKLIREKNELPNGYAYRFEDSDKNIDLLTDFIKTERQCCDFFNFSMEVNNDRSAWLKITGAKGVKGFITSELEL